MSKDCNLIPIDYEGEYAGFEINAHNNINCGGIIGDILLYTHNSEHYDALININNFQTCLAQRDNNETLPNFILID
jgi:hypothetical protein